MASDDSIPPEALGWLNKLVAPLTKQFQERSDQVAVEMRHGFYNYGQRVVERCGFVKTIISGGERLDITSFYVSPEIKIGRSTYNAEQLSDRLASKKRIIITGTAGLGKSILLKYISVQFSQISKRPLPIFLELRDLNDGSQTIEEAAFNLISTPKAFLSRSQFEYGLKEGLLALFLDAFDEVNTELRNRYEKEIISLSYKYPDTQIIVTSRPSADGVVESWESFEHGSLQPFNLSRVIQLVKKIENEEEDKDKFIVLLETKLFESHKSFLSTPLLALIMFLTFRAGGQIPNKLHEFYRRAFEALFYKHDTMKSHYNRRPHTDLGREDFLRIISAFCAITYFEGQLSFADDELYKRIDEVKQVETMDVDTHSLANDLIESLCLLQRDGAELAFTHRSFQEYFTALYIINSESLDTFAIINRLMGRQRFDNVIILISEMNREFLEKKWLIPWLNMYEEGVKGFSVKDNVPKYMKIMRYSTFLIYSRGKYRFGFAGIREGSSAIGVIITKLYNEKFSLHFRENSGEFNMEKTNVEIGEYLLARDKIIIPKKKSDRQNLMVIRLTDADAEVFKGTYIADYMEAQRDFALKIREEIQERHKQKGEGFMNLIRNRSKPS